MKKIKKNNKKNNKNESTPSIHSYYGTKEAIVVILAELSAGIIVIALRYIFK